MPQDATIRVLLFGPPAIAAGAASVCVTASASATGPEVLAAIGAQFPALRPFAPHARLAVNGRYADSALRITSGDEVALICMVSGG